jgi:hypothetical protein
MSVAFSAFMILDSVGLPDATYTSSILLLYMDSAVSIVLGAGSFAAVAFFALVFLLVESDIRMLIASLTEERHTYMAAVDAVDAVRHNTAELSSRARPVLLLMILTVFLGSVLGSIGVLVALNASGSATLYSGRQSVLIASLAVIGLEMVYALLMWVAAARVASAADDLAPACARFVLSEACDVRGARARALIVHAEAAPMGVWFLGIRLSLVFVAGLISTFGSLFLVALRSAVVLANVL